MLQQSQGPGEAHTDTCTPIVILDSVVDIVSACMHAIEEMVLHMVLLFRRRGYSTGLVLRLVIVVLDGMGADFLGKKEKRALCACFRAPILSLPPVAGFNFNPYATIRLKSFPERGRRAC